MEMLSGSSRPMKSLSLWRRKTVTSAWNRLHPFWFRISLFAATGCGFIHLRRKKDVLSV